MRHAVAIAPILLVAACARSTGSDGVPPPTNPPPGSGPVCDQACGEGPKEPGPLGDPIEFLGVGTDNFGGFFEPVEVKVVGDRVAMCTGVRGLAVYRAEDPCCLSLEGTVRPAPSRQYPRCQHIEWINDWVYISNHGDEISPESFVTAVDVSSVADATTIGTHLAEDDVSYEGLASYRTTLYAAQHERGLAVFQIQGNGDIELVREIQGGLVNAWEPVVDADRELMVVADAQGGIGLFSLADPQNPAPLGRAATVGTIKAVVIVGDYVYGASGTAGVEIFSIADPANPTMVRRVDTPGSALGIDASNGMLVVADWNDVQVFDIANPENPTLVGHQKAYAGRANPEPTPLGRILDVAIDGDTFYMAEWEAPQSHRIVRGVDAPDIFVDAAIELPRTDPGAQSNAGLVIANRGRLPLELTNVSVDAPFRVEVASTTIEPGSQTLATVFFDPMNPVAATARLVIESNDPDEPFASVQVQGNLTGLRTGDPVPDLTFTDLDGFTHELAEFRGRPVLLAYFATF